jgi:hypothetical protein
VQIQAFLKELEGEFLKASSASAATGICKNALIFQLHHSLFIYIYMLVRDTVVTFAILPLI